MKRLVFVLAAALALFSCDKSHDGGELGGWDPMEIDHPTLNFTSEGGQQTVSVINYESWWINYGYESASYINGSWEYTNPVLPTSTDPEFPSDQLDGGWYQVSIPKDKPNTAVVKVDINATSTPRNATVEMQLFNAFGKFEIHQDTK